MNNKNPEYLINKTLSYKLIHSYRWIKRNLFNNFFNSLITIGILYFLIKFSVLFIKWAFVNSTCLANECPRNSGGACWAVVWQNIRFILFGFYPQDQQWRPFLTIIILISLLFATKNKKFWGKALFYYAWPTCIFTMAILMSGGLFGLAQVDSEKWSGLPLTFLLATFGMFLAYPWGVILALGRKSKMPIIRSICVIYIEIVRGVPLISVLFMSSVMFPLFLPEGMIINKILRAQVAIILFTGAYIAEVVRGGLQAIPKGQYEAAESIGLNYYQKMRFVILPQALKIVIPPTVGILVSAFKDTSLVVVIALYDLLKTSQVVLSNPTWSGFSTEIYLFLAVFYFICCFTMSNYSRKLEKSL